MLFSYKKIFKDAILAKFDRSFHPTVRRCLRREAGNIGLWRESLVQIFRGVAGLLLLLSLAAQPQ